MILMRVVVPRRSLIAAGRVRILAPPHNRDKAIIRCNSTNEGSKPFVSPPSPVTFKTEAEKLAYLEEANAKMEEYHKARELLRQGKLKSKNQQYYQKQGGSETVQLGIAAVFVVSFLATPFLGRKIARDDEFRRKWVPSWLDFTVPKPERPWTRDELHEQMVQVQREIRERAIAGEFTPDKLEKLHQTFESLQENQQVPHKPEAPKSEVEKKWDKIHMGMDDDEKLNER